MAATLEKKGSVVVVQFGIEADHPRNCDLLIQSIPGLRLRSAFDPSKPVKHARTGEDVVPIDQARNLASFPRTPGMQLNVNPAELTYEVYDPLYEDEEMMDRVTKWFVQHHALRSAKMRGVKPKKAKTDIHRMKTLCREMLCLVQAGEAKLVRGKGPLPDLDEIGELPGHFLLNPGSRVRNSQPRFEKDYEEWFERVSLTGGLDN